MAANPLSWLYLSRFASGDRISISKESSSSPLPR
jgi:hypothetical protein